MWIDSPDSEWGPSLSMPERAAMLRRLEADAVARGTTYSQEGEAFFRMMYDRFPKYASASAQGGKNGRS